MIDVAVDLPGSTSREYGYDALLEIERLMALRITLPLGPSQPSQYTESTPIALAGAISLTSQPFVSQFSWGGSISISHVEIDPSTRRVYASITGNFLGVPGKTFAPLGNTTITTIDNFHLFDYAGGTSVGSLSPGDEMSVTFSGLTITNAGQYHLISSLRLYATGAAWLRTINNYGDITTTITPIPEPSVSMLALTGIGIAVATRRTRRSFPRRRCQSVCESS